MQPVRTQAKNRPRAIVDFFATRLAQIVLSLLLLSFAFPAAAAGRACIDLFRHYGKIISMEPKDAMGAEFREAFGAYIQTHDATSKNLEALAIELFTMRLELAKKHGTKFAKMMVAEKDGEAVELWRERWEGVSDGMSWSFGIEGHKRADPIWHLLNANLDPHAAKTAQVKRSDFEIFGGPGPDAVIDAKVWEFPYPVDGVELGFRVYQLDTKTYFIAHARDREVPRIRARLGKLWSRALDPKLRPRARMNALIEFEWLWYWTNPFGRSGALIGDSVSLLVQRQLEAEGLPIAIRTGYHSVDLDAITRSLPDYARARRAQLRPKPATSGN